MGGKQRLNASKQTIERAGEQQAERVCDVTLSPRRNSSHFSVFFSFFFLFNKTRQLEFLAQELID